MTWISWDSLLRAGVSVALGVVLWLLCRLLISFVVRRASDGRSLLENARLRKGLQWASPVLPAMDGERRAQRARTIGSLLQSVCNVLIGAIVTIYVLLSFGVNVVPLVTSLGIVGVAVGFGCQQLIRDFLAGVFLAIEDQYGIGDFIETAEVKGTVESVGLRITRLRAEDGAIWYLRNGELMRVGNHTQGQHAHVRGHDEASKTEPQLPLTPQEGQRG